jgi:SAM-dependent methyltransferase
MSIARRAATFMRALLKSYGPAKIKRMLWDEEFSGGKWNFIDDTAGDCVYGYLEKYAADGSILDLGCGPGNTANELRAEAYRTYIGVDISEAALDKARRRTKENGRAAKNRFACSDFLSYMPPQQFDVILFRESMYHVPLGKVKTILDRYARYLAEGGVFVVRLAAHDESGHTKHRPNAMLAVMETEFDVVEKGQHKPLKNGDAPPTVIVFRPKVRVAVASNGPVEAHKSHV